MRPDANLQLRSGRSSPGFSRSLLPSASLVAPLHRLKSERRNHIIHHQPQQQTVRESGAAPSRHLIWCMLMALTIGACEVRSDGLNQTTPFDEASILQLIESDSFYVGRARDFAIDEQGVFYVADGLAERVLAFGPDGRPLRSFGHRGAGPGELGQIGPIAVSETTVSVVDINDHHVYTYNRQSGILMGFHPRGAGPGELGQIGPIAVSETTVSVVDINDHHVYTYNRQSGILMGFRPYTGMATTLVARGEEVWAGNLSIVDTASVSRWGPADTIPTRFGPFPARGLSPVESSIFDLQRGIDRFRGLAHGRRVGGVGCVVDLRGGVHHADR